MGVLQTQDLSDTGPGGYTDEASFEISFLNHLFEVSHKGRRDFHPVTASPCFSRDFAKSLPAASFSSRALAREARYKIKLQETW